MKNSSIQAESITRVLIYLIVAVGTSLSYGTQKLVYFAVLYLVFVLNSRIRIIILRYRKNNRLLIISLFADFALIYMLFNSYPLITYLLILVTLLDSLTFLETEGYIIAVLSCLMLLYCVKDKSVEIFMFSVLISGTVIAFAAMAKRLRRTIETVEELFDRNRRYSYELEDSRKILQDYAKKIEELSLFRERNRISRDIHDTLGHKLTGVLMQLDAAIMALMRDYSKGNEMICSVRDNLSESIEILRNTVKNINPGNQSNRAVSIEHMISDFRRITGVDIQFDILGTINKLYPSIEAALYRNAQEGITNAVKHGKATCIWITLEYGENQVILRVKDNGCGCSDIIKGMGIRGMEERTALVYGELSINKEDGFEVTTVIPVKS